MWKRHLKQLLELGLNTVCTIITRFGREEELVSLSETFAGKWLSMELSFRFSVLLFHF